MGHPASGTNHNLTIDFAPTLSSQAIHVPRLVFAHLLATAEPEVARHDPLYTDCKSL
jgi:hypothetical protein